MGKTYRKSKARRDYHSLGDTDKYKEDYIKKQIQKLYIRAASFGEWVPRTGEEMEADYQSQLPAHEKNMRQYKMNLHFHHYAVKRYKIHLERLASDGKYRNDLTYILREPTPPREPRIHVSPRKWVPLTKSFEEFFEENYEKEEKWYNKRYSRGRIRDGIYSESGRSSGYKKQTSKERRNQDREKIVKIISNPEEAENMVWYEHKDGKKHIWNWW